MSYLVPPGLYAIGAPTPGDPVLVTANYKMSYDLVRRALAGRNAWLLVLETHGINVWCAAGKGTFGSEELVARIEASRLAQVVEHRLLILPLLGAPGVSAFEVRARTGFSVRFAAIRAADIPRYLDGGMETTPQMRELTFTLRERLVLIPVELVIALKGSVWIVPLLALAAAWRDGRFAPAAAIPGGSRLLRGRGGGHDRHPAGPPLAADAQLCREGRGRRGALVPALSGRDGVAGLAAAATVLLVSARQLVPRPELHRQHTLHLALRGEEGDAPLDAGAGRRLGGRHRLLGRRGPALRGRSR